jgi:2-polyprenyl-6-methoxyphenol hydroxylase-like FAD-dependent oxidoreductase/phytoene/squalene synthetase
MSELRGGYDVVIAGAGPAGIAAAAAFAARGAEVLLVEAEPGAAKRLAGEWLHPPGVAILEDLGLLPEERLLDHPWGRGFVIFPEDGSAPIELPYAGDDRAVACEHAVLVAAMRERLRGRARVTYLPGARLTELDDGCVTLGRGPESRRITAGLVIGADGKGSTVRKRLYPGETARAVSHMAGLLLEDVTLPFEGAGHVFVGGPGPALLYRIDARRVRLCLDLPAAHGRRGPAELWDAFAPVLHPALRASFRAALERAPIAWAANRLRPRLDYGRGRVALVGDAVGVVHPLCAAGMTLGLADVVRLAEAGDVASYAARREEESHVPELLSQALYEVLVRIDPSATAIREAMYRTFRESAHERVRTMSLLAGREVGREPFSSAFVHVALNAVRDALDQARGGRPLSAASEVRRLAEWSRYPSRALSPRPIRLRQRARPLGPGSAIRPLSPSGAAPAALDPRVLRAPTSCASTSDAGALRRASAALARAVDRGDAEMIASAARSLLEALGATSDARLDELAAAAEALDAARDTHPGLAGDALATALRRVSRRVLARAQDDHGFGDLRATAHAIRALRASGHKSVHPRVRRAVDHLLDRQLEDGGFADDGADVTHTTAEVLRALLRAECADSSAVHRAATRLARAFPFPSSAAESAHAALALYHRRVADAPHEAPRRMARASDGSLRGADWVYCVEALERVSRSFARPIATLPEPLRAAVTAGYLLCRIADTVEDAPDASPDERDGHYGRLLDALEGRGEPSAFAREVGRLAGKTEEIDLAEKLGRVLNVLASVPEPMADAVKRWSAEMVRGMAIYSHRPVGADGLRAPRTIADLERYCFFVAGTVGHMLTDLFLVHAGEVSPATRLALREEAESFGIGLQLVNILKDVTDDYERGVAYVPRSLTDARGMSLHDMVSEGRRGAAHAVVGPLFDLARHHLDRALEYVIALPAEQPRVRLYFLLPLWKAARTLVHARGNDAMLVPGRPVKIDRAEVEALAADCFDRVDSEESLRAGYAALWSRPRRIESAARPMLHR